MRITEIFIFYFYYITTSGLYDVYLKNLFLPLFNLKSFQRRKVTMKQIFFSEFPHLAAQTYVIFRGVRRACRALRGKLRRVWPDPFVAVFTLECSLSLANWALDAATFTRCARLCSHVEHSSCVAQVALSALSPLPSQLALLFPSSLFLIIAVRFLYSRLTAFTANATRKSAVATPTALKTASAVPTSLIYFGSLRVRFNYWIRRGARGRAWQTRNGWDGWFALCFRRET